METLKFLFTSSFYPPYHIGGDAVHVKYLAEALAKIGHEVHVFHSIDAYRLKRKNTPKDVDYCGVHTHPIQTPFKSSSYLAYFLGGSLSVTKKFQSLVEEIRPDVVHHHNISLLGFKILGKQNDYINLYTVHDYWLVCQQNNLLKNGSRSCSNGVCFLCSLRCKKPPQIWRYTDGFKNVLGEIDCIISPSDYLKKRIAMGVHSRIVTIPNFIPSSPMNIGASGFSDFFLYAGVLENHKGILNLVKLYAESNLAAKLVVVGQGSLTNKIKTFVQKFGLEEKIFLVGWADHDTLYPLLSDANALIVPSICLENNPLIILEALSVGTPAIVSNKGGMPEIIERVNRKLIFDDLEILKDILSSFSKKNFSSTEIKRVYEQYYSPEAYIRKYFETIGSIKKPMGRRQID
jgi:glycosyltransferase involved in cell wall biosynthesis